jgi:SAM-dependent methyltransferase
MIEPTWDTVKNYYDARIAEKLRDFTHPLPRIEAGIQTLAEWAPANPRRILEIGCGIGATSWRMARAWPQAEVIGTDISPLSIEVANTCFKRPNLSYRAVPISEGVLDGEFDLVLMMDVYEHIAPSARTDVHAALKTLLSAESRFILTIPTPATQEYGRLHCPEAMQPIDEDIGLQEIATIAKETGTKFLYYREVGIWRYGDYFHLVLGKYQSLVNVTLRQATPEGLAVIKRPIKRLLGRIGTEPGGRRDYLGADLLRPARAIFASRFHVSLAERRSLASAWLQRGTAGLKKASASSR